MPIARPASAGVSTLTLVPVFLVALAFPPFAAADLPGVGLPADAARLPFGLPDTTDPLGGLGRGRDMLDDPIRGDFDTPLYRLGPEGRARPAAPVGPVAPVRSPPPDPRPGATVRRP